MQQVETRYAWLGRDRIAYQVLGVGPPDLVVSFGSFGHIDIVDAGPMALLFAATKPERTSALVLVNCTPKWVVSDDYPIGIPLEVAQEFRTQLDRLWGTDGLVAMWAASRVGDERFRRWSTKYQRAMASPRTIQALTSVILELDSRPILPLVQAPTLVLAKRDFPIIPIQQARYLAEHLPNAKLVELPGD